MEWSSSEQIKTRAAQAEIPVLKFESFSIVIILLKDRERVLRISPNNEHTG